MRIAFLGDSLTEGRPGESFLDRLRPRLPDDVVRNHGRAGDTIAGLLARLEAGELGPADLAVVWIGTNDAFLGDWYLPPLLEAGGGAAASPETGGAASHDTGISAASGAAGGHLRPLYERVLDLTLSRAPLAVCVPPVLPDPFAEDGVAARVSSIGAMVAATADARAPRTRLFELAPAFGAARAAEPRRHFTIDGVHLNTRGAHVVAAAFHELIAALRADADAPARRD